MKVGKIEKRSIDAKDLKMELTKAYDDNGNVVSEIDNAENIREWFYDRNNIISIRKNGTELYCMKYLGDGTKYKEEIIEGGKIKIYAKGEIKYAIESFFSGDTAKFTLCDGNIIKPIKVIYNR